MPRPPSMSGLRGSGMPDPYENAGLPPGKTATEFGATA